MTESSLPPAQDDLATRTTEAGGVSRRRLLQAGTVTAGAFAVGTAAHAQAAAAAPGVGSGAAAGQSAAPASAGAVAALAAEDNALVAGGDKLTTSTGLRIPSDSDTLKAGERGPSLLEDFHFREKIMHFDHERVPERAVHARGAGAHGTFVLTESLAAYTRAKVLTEVGKKTPVFARFSTVNGSRGSADCVRDARGFAVKMYTSEGNWDLVGNNIPVFFIQDAIKFPDLVHSFKPEPLVEIPQASTAHDNFWDFISLSPESMHMIMWAMSDRAIPRSLRMMDGFTVHTFRLVNERGNATLVKFHWKAKLGVHSLVWDEAVKLNGADPDFHRRDLADAITRKQFPQWDLAVQLLSERDASRLGIDVLDPTKLWPEEKVPLKVVGTMTLDRNPQNYFAETEQSAFHPGHLVPGIDVTEDPLLQGRLFSYLDTQLNRFNSANFNQLPINRPVAPVNNFQQDGYMRAANRPGNVNYNPNSLGPQPSAASAKDGGFITYPLPMEGRKVRTKPGSFGDHYSQATMFYRSLTPPEQAHVIGALQFELAKVASGEVKARVLQHLANIDAGLTKAVAKVIGLPAPNGRPSSKAGLSPSLSQERTPKSAATRKVAILVADGVNAGDVSAMQGALKDAGVVSVVVGSRVGAIRAGSGGDVTATAHFRSTNSVEYDAVYVPGGKGSVDAIAVDGDARHFIEEAYKHYKSVAATGEAQALVKEVTGATGGTAAAGVVLGGDAGAIGKAFVDAITADRHWARTGTDRVSA